MNDYELDEMLNSWAAPPVPATLRERVRIGFRARFESRPRPRWFLAFRFPVRVMVAVGVFLLILAKAAPVVLGAPEAAANAALVVDREDASYLEDGSTKTEIYTASYDKDGREIPLSRSIPNDRLGTFEERTFELFLILHQALIGSIPGHYSEERPSNISALRNAGCAIEPVTARETILNYPTVAVSHTPRNRQRSTVWMAPALGCMALRYTLERQQPDGTYRLLAQNRTLNVIVK